MTANQKWAVIMLIIAGTLAVLGGAQAALGEYGMAVGDIAVSIICVVIALREWRAPT